MAGTLLTDDPYEPYSGDWVHALVMEIIARHDAQQRLAEMLNPELRFPHLAQFMRPNREN